MKTRPLGWTEEPLTTVGLGAWAIGGGGWSFGWGPQDDAESVQTIHAALDTGINWIDTAPVYGLGHSEAVVGQALKTCQTHPFVATKCGLVWDDDGKISGRLRAKSVRAECDASLQRLGIDVIDLYQVHWPNPDEEIEEAWTTIAELVESGKVRYAGVSNFSVSQIQRAQAIHPVASLQPPYSMLARGVEEDLLAFCAEQKIGVVAYSPMQKGLLTGKVTKAWLDGLAADDHRRQDPMFTEPELSKHLEQVEALRRVADRLGVSRAQLAVAWVLRRPEVTAAIVGGRRPQQVAENAAAMDVTLSAGDLEEIERILA
jgi:aryl-alcohol dehydrogenase-like predicted oxidoreductase